MRKKKTYKCKICGKKYQGYRRTNTCSHKCAVKSFKQYLQRISNPTPEMRKKWYDMSLEFRDQYYAKKGNWYEAWKRGIKKALR